jgi:hypothetical protein
VGVVSGRHDTLVDSLETRPALCVAEKGARQDTDFTNILDFFHNIEVFLKKFSKHFPREGLATEEGGAIGTKMCERERERESGESA